MGEHKMLQTPVNPEMDIEVWIDRYTEKLMQRAQFLLSNPEDARDIVQDVFVEACRQKSKFRGQSSPLTWLMKILYHKVSDHYRRSYRKEVYDLSRFFNKYGDWVSDPQAITWDEDIRLMDDEAFTLLFKQCLRDLPDNCRMAITLCYLKQLPATDICTIMNISQANYWKLLQRGRLSLKESLERKWFQKK